VTASGCHTMRFSFKPRLPTATKQRIFLPISVGNKQSEGAKFTELIGKLQGNLCHIVVCDTLQRFNVERTDQKECLRIASLNGAAWIYRNHSSILWTETETELSRWSEWTSDPQFPTLLQDTQHLFDRDATFRVACEAQIRGSLSLKYILEECAVLPLWAPHADNLIYPGTIGPAIRAAHAAFRLRYALTEVAIRSKKARRQEGKKGIP